MMPFLVPPQVAFLFTLNDAPVQFGNWMYSLRSRSARRCPARTGPAVVTPARTGRAREALVLAEAVLRRPAHGRDVDPRVEQAAGGAGPPAEGGTGKKPPWSAPVGPPLPVNVNSMIALPPLVGVAAMAGMLRFSCFGETYPWLVSVNLRVLSNDLVRSPSTPRPCGSPRWPWCGLGNLGAGGRPNLALRLRSLGQVVAVGSQPVRWAGGEHAQAGRSALIAQRYRAVPLRGEDPAKVAVSGS